MRERLLSSAAISRVSSSFRFDHAFCETGVRSFSTVDALSCETLAACTSVRDFVIAFDQTLTRYVHRRFPPSTSLSGAM